MPRRRGYVLILAIFFLGLIQLVALRFAQTIPLEVSGVGRFKQEVQADLAVDAGVQDTIAYLEHELVAGHEPTLSDRPTLTRTGQWGDLEWEAEVIPDSRTTPNGYNTCRYYTIRCTAKQGDQPLRTLRVGVGQESFTRYARFIDRWPQNPGEEVYFMGGPITVDGPVHCNDVLQVGARSGFYSSTDFLFQEGATGVADPEYLDFEDGPPTTNGQSDPAKLFRLFGAKGFQRVNEIRVPQRDTLAINAWGASTAPPTADGVYLNQVGGRLAGGVYVQGDLDRLELVGQGQVLTQGDQTWRISEDPATRTTRVEGPQGTTTYNGLPNGSIYASGDIRWLAGVNHGDHTVGVDVFGKHQVRLGGDVTSQDPSRDRLGIVTYRFVVPGPSALSRDRDLRVEAAVFAAGGDDHEGGALAEDIGSPGLAVLNLRGCLIEGRRRRLAQMSTESGWNLQVTHDSRLTRDPPPFFPTLPKLHTTSIIDEK